VDSSAAIAEASPTPLATALRTGASAQATAEQTIAADEYEASSRAYVSLLLCVSRERDGRIRLGRGHVGPAQRLVRPSRRLSTDTRAGGHARVGNARTSRRQPSTTLKEKDVKRTWREKRRFQHPSNRSSVRSTTSKRSVGGGHNCASSNLVAWSVLRLRRSMTRGVRL
jgi:hypothetical protein